MINFVEGTFTEKLPTHVIINIHGIGYEIKISLITYGQIKTLDEGRLYTHFHVKEDSQTLYGFHDLSEKSRFKDLIGISGVGPSIALMVLSSLSAEELQSAVINGQVKVIQSVKGIGGKTAERIILELKDKFKKESLTENIIDLSGESNNTLRAQALSALITLGIAKPAVEKTIDKIMSEHENLRLEELIKLTLKRV
ncbi:MAG: Holliday junction branch migration protein RuvA [Flammeovirgaceae bacterium]|nr:Holliday junction branch migration protein RuvA [Flammeovirgaceae bacterium]